MRCTVCGGDNGQDHLFCIHCGTCLGPTVSTPRFARRPAAPGEAPAATTREGKDSPATALDGQQKIAVFSAAAIAVSFITVFLLSAGNLRVLPALLLLFLPIILGELIFLLRARKAVALIERFEARVREKGEISACGNSLVHRWFAGPLCSCVAKALRKTDGIENRYLRAGMVATASLYVAGFIMYVTAAVAAAVFLG